MQEMQGEIIQLLNRYDLPISSKFSVLVATAINEGLKEKSIYELAEMLRRQASAEEHRHSAPRRQ